MIEIRELVDVCAAMAARNDAWFGTLGRAVAQEGDSARQRWLAVAAHRHAWHAELWRSRTPSIPIEHETEPGASPVGADAATYVVELERLRADVDALAGRVDADLDPSTRRVLDLVAHDLDDLARGAA